MEPLTIVAIAAGVSGAAGKFVEKAWDQGEKWLSDYFKDHAPKAKEKAERNSLDFLNQLATRVNMLEEQGAASKPAIEDSLGQPDFSVLLQKAIVSSAQTDSNEKHRLLARLVADRMAVESESLFALTSQLACDAISRMNGRHMMILGLITDIMMVRPVPLVPKGMGGASASRRFSDWLVSRLGVYQDVTFTNLDFLHLESLSCLKWDSIAFRDLQGQLGFPQESGITFEYSAFSETPVGKKIEGIWASGLGHAMPTTVGQLIGVYVTDMLTGTNTSMAHWDQCQVSV